MDDDALRVAASAGEDDNDYEEWCDAPDRIASLDEETLPPSSPMSSSPPPPPLDDPASPPATSPLPSIEARLDPLESNGEFTPVVKSENEEDDDDGEDDTDGHSPSRRKRKSLSSLAAAAAIDSAAAEPSPSPAPTTVAAAVAAASKKPKKKANNVWTKPTSRRKPKKSKTPSSALTNGSAAGGSDDVKVIITPVPRFLDKSDDSPTSTICLSKVHKAERVELSDDRLAAGSTKGYRMVRATRGVQDGAWYFEIKVVRLGESGHTRLGWTTEKGDLQAPVGFDGNSFGYRDIDGTKVHKALREEYGGEGYGEGDVIGFYISLPDGGVYAPKPPQLVWYKGQKYICAADMKDEPPKEVPGSEMVFFKNGVCQGVAFRDLLAGRYYPAASMYTLPGHPNCEVRFNFGPAFDFLPEDFGGRPDPRPMVEAPYHGLDGASVSAENGDATAAATITAEKAL